MTPESLELQKVHDFHAIYEITWPFFKVRIDGTLFSIYPLQFFPAVL
jgi:hypothetical protein